MVCRVFGNHFAAGAVKPKISVIGEVGLPPELRKSRQRFVTLNPYVQCQFINCSTFLKTQRPRARRRKWPYAHGMIRRNSSHHEPAPERRRSGRTVKHAGYHPVLPVVIGNGQIDHSRGHSGIERDRPNSARTGELKRNRVVRYRIHNLQPNTEFGCAAVVRLKYPVQLLGRIGIGQINNRMTPRQISVARRQKQDPRAVRYI